MKVIVAIFIGTSAAIIGAAALASRGIGWRQLRRQFVRNNQNHQRREEA